MLLWSVTIQFRGGNRAVLLQKVQEHCRESIPDKACLPELGWCTGEVIVMYVKCERYEKKGCYVKENRGQEVISKRQRWCGC